MQALFKDHIAEVGTFQSDLKVRPSFAAHICFDRRSNSDARQIGLQITQQTEDDDFAKGIRARMTVGDRTQPSGPPRFGQFAWDHVTLFTQDTDHPTAFWCAAMPAIGHRRVCAMPSAQHCAQRCQPSHCSRRFNSAH